MITSYRVDDRRDYRKVTTSILLGGGKYFLNGSSSIVSENHSYTLDEST